MERLTTAQTYATLCIAICAFALNYRVFPLLPLTAFSDIRASQPLRELTWQGYAGGQDSPVLQLQVMIGMLAAGLVIQQAWGLLPRLGGSRKRLMVLTSLSLLGGLGMVSFGLLEKIPLSVPDEVFAIEVDLPIHRGLIYGDPEYREEADLAIMKYLVTHSDSGSPIRLHQIRRNQPPGLHYELDELRIGLCELCLLPGVGVWTTGGLPFLLGENLPIDPEPRTIVELPRHSGYGRLYGPSNAAALTRLPIADIPVGIGSSDWVVVKIDFNVAMDEVHRLLAGLRDHGVRRVDFAVLPEGLQSLPRRIPTLSLNREPETTVYEPRRSGVRFSNSIVVRRYVPPPSGDLRQRCNEVDSWDHHRAWARHAPQPPGSLPDRIRVSTEPDTLYGDFIGVLQSALPGGVETVEITLE